MSDQRRIPTTRARLRAWLAGDPPPPVPDPPASVDLSEPAGLAICCSGGGIRSASYCLGGLQALDERGVYAGARVVTAVSGGSYIAASYALARSPGDAADAYARQSPEERHLRDNSRYLLPTAPVVFRGVLSLAFGLVANLGLVLLGLAVLARPLGWLLGWTGILGGLGAARSTYLPFATGWQWLWAGLLLAALLLYLLDWLRVDRRVGGRRPPGSPATEQIAVQRRTRRLTRAYSWRGLVAGVAAAALLAGAPAAVAGLYNLGVHNSGSHQLALVLSKLGYTTAEGCQSYLDATAGTAGVCGEPSAQIRDQAAAAGEDPTASAQPSANGRGNSSGQTGGLVGFFLAFVGVLKLVVGRLGFGGSDAKPKPGERQSWLSGLAGRVITAARRVLLPWAGSAAVSALLLLVSLKWTKDAAYNGLVPSEAWIEAVLAVAFGWGLYWSDITASSLHPFYRERLSSAFAVRRTADNGAEEIPYEIPLYFSTLHEDGPELVVCAAANNGEVGMLPPGRGCVSFTFAKESTGISDGLTGSAGWRVDTPTYERAVPPRLLTIPGAVAISGAAVSPVMGKTTRRPVRLLLAIANVRLGVWVLNPAYVNAAAARAPRGGMQDAWTRALERGRRPSPFHLLFEAFGRNSLRRRYLYVTDGGHYENLGLVEALRRRPAEVVAFDASGDQVTTWRTLGQAIALARTELGVEVDLDPTGLGPDPEGWAQAPYVAGWFRFADEPVGTRHRLWVAKLGVPLGAPWDVRAYKIKHLTFPTDSTLQQLYDDEEFEAYRALGYYAASTLLDAREQADGTPPRVPWYPLQRQLEEPTPRG